MPDSVLLGTPRQFAFTGFQPVVGQELVLELQPQLVVRVRAERIERGDGGSWRWVGRVLDSPAGADGTAVFVVRQGQVGGTVRFGGRLFLVRPRREQLHFAVEVNTTRVRLENDAPKARRDTTPWLAGDQPPGGAAMTQRASTAACSDTKDLFVGGMPTVRLLVLYTEAALAADADLPSAIEGMILEVNQAFEQSGVRVLVELAAARLVTGFQDSAVASDVILESLISLNDGVLDEVQAIRDSVHADVVGLLVENSEGGAAGRKPNAKYLISADQEAYAFFVDNRQLALTQYSLAHELGHLMGAQHDWSAGLPTKDPYPYGHAHVATNAGWSTIMAVSAVNRRIPRFSNPGLLYSDALSSTPAPTGASSPLATDNRRALNNGAQAVAAYRVSPVWLVSVGASAPWKELRVADEGVEQVILGDLDGDGLADAFRVDEAQGQWYWSKSAEEPWLPLGPSDPARGVPISELRLVDLNGNGKVDVFRSDVGAQQWFWSEDAVDDWKPLDQAQGPSFAIPVASLAFGDFDGNGAVDVFYSDAASRQWNVAYGGRGGWRSLGGGGGGNATAGVPTVNLAIADLNGDGVSDVFQSTPGNHIWRWSASGTASWATLRNVPDAAETQEYVLGDFDGDGKADVFQATGTAWQLSSGGTAAWRRLRESCYRLSALRFTDLDGDGRADVFRGGIRP